MVCGFVALSKSERRVSSLGSKSLSHMDRPEDFDVDSVTLEDVESQITRCETLPSLWRGEPFRIFAKSKGKKQSEGLMKWSNALKSRKRYRERRETTSHPFHRERANSIFESVQSGHRVLLILRPRPVQASRSAKEPRDDLESVDLGRSSLSRGHLTHTGPDPATAERMTEAIDAVRLRGNSIGGVVECVVPSRGAICDSHRSRYTLSLI